MGIVNKLSQNAWTRKIRALAGDTFFDRGQAYFRRGAVVGTYVTGGTIKAVVQGTRRYRIRIWEDDGELGYDCTCPVGRDALFCKHCVAVGLAWHAEPGNEEASALTDEDIRSHLLTKDKDALVSLLLEIADRDDAFHQRLLVTATEAIQGDTDGASWQEAFSQALALDHFDPYADNTDLIASVTDTISVLEDLLKDGQARKVVGLAEFALGEIEENIEAIYDADEWIWESFGRLQDIHLRACQAARLDPEELAQRLFDGERVSEFDAFSQAVLTYQDILGKAGLEAYRRLAEAAWAQLEPLASGETDRHDSDRWILTRMMETLAEMSNDPEALIAIKSRNLSSPNAYFQIARLCADVGDSDTAFDWAERGWEAFQDQRQDEDLRAFLANAYQDRGRHDKAIALIWEAFTNAPSLNTFQHLQRHAELARVWVGWREKALALIRKRIADHETSETERRWGYGSFDDHSLLVEIFLDERDPNSAWKEAATGGCRDHLWVKLANQRSKTHPEDAIEVYRNQINAVLRNTGNHFYEKAVDHLSALKAIVDDTQREEDFVGVLAEVRAVHRRKRNLIKMLDKKGW